LHSIKSNLDKNNFKETHLDRSSFLTAGKAIYTAGVLAEPLVNIPVVTAIFFGGFPGELGAPGNSLAQIT
jgi:hypothetical protein